MLAKYLVLFAFFAVSLGTPVPDDDEISVEEGGERALDWFKTPFKEVKVECHPEPDSVLCNFEAMVLSMQLNGGFSAKFNSEAKTVNVKVLLNGDPRFEKEFSYGKAENLCFAKEVPMAGEMEVCLITKVEQKENNDVVACPRILFYIDKQKFDGEEWAELIFNCPTLTANGISWTRPVKDKDGSDALKDKKYLRFKTHNAVKKGLKYSSEKIYELINTHLLKGKKE